MRLYEAGNLVRWQEHTNVHEADKVFVVVSSRVEEREPRMTTPWIDVEYVTISERGVGGVREVTAYCLRRAWDEEAKRKENE